MGENEEGIQYILRYYFKKGKTPVKTARKICAVYGEEAVSVKTAREWFSRFRAESSDDSKIRINSRKESKNYVEDTTTEHDSQSNMDAKQTSKKTKKKKKKKAKKNQEKKETSQSPSDPDKENKNDESDSSNTLEVSSFAAEQLGLLDLNGFPGANLQDIGGYGVNKKTRISFARDEKHEKLLRDMWSGRLCKYAVNPDTADEYKAYIKEKYGETL